VTAIGPAEQTGYDFGELVRTHQSMVFSLVWHFLHDRETAEEVAQEVFLALHRNLASIQSREHVLFWLRKVAVQRAIDEARRRRRRPVVALAAVAEPAADDGGPGDPLLAGLLRRLVATLPEAPRSVMILRYQEDLDPSEIARILEMPVGTVKSHLQRSLALLREKLNARPGRPVHGERSGDI
jgi:RNA polymerase sigma-70 factor (ECF subfamily)